MYIDTKSSDPQKCKNINIDLLWPPPVPLKIIGQRRPLTQQKKICLFNMFTSYVLSNEKKFTHNLENCSSKIQQSYKHDYENNNGQKFSEEIFNF